MNRIGLLAQFQSAGLPLPSPGNLSAAEIRREATTPFRRAGIPGSLLALLLALPLVAACDGGPTEAGPGAHTLQVDSTSLVMEEHQGRTLSVTVVDPQGRPLATVPAGMSITWTSSDTSVVTARGAGTVDTGRIIGIAPGRATVTAAAGTATVEVSVEVGPAPWEVAWIPTPGDYGRAHGISEEGIVVGRADPPAPDFDWSSIAFSWTRAGGFRYLSPPETNGSAEGIAGRFAFGERGSRWNLDERGEVLGKDTVPNLRGVNAEGWGIAAGEGRGTVHHPDGTLAAVLVGPDGGTAFPAAINTHGDVVGWSMASEEVVIWPGGSYDRSVRIAAGSLGTPLLLNDQLDIVHRTGEAAQLHIFRGDGWETLDLPTLPGAGGAHPAGLSNRTEAGEIRIVGSADAQGARPILWTVTVTGAAGPVVEVRELPVPAVRGGWAYGINSSGVIVGAGHHGRYLQPLVWTPRD